jgi:hypothetical protein
MNPNGRRTILKIYLPRNPVEPDFRETHQIVEGTHSPCRGVNPKPGVSVAQPRVAKFRKYTCALFGHYHDKVMIGFGFANLKSSKSFSERYPRMHFGFCLAPVNRYLQ